MGSLGGHMSHLWEDLDLTFGDINEIFYQACTGNLGATEKFDGINVHFRVDPAGDLRFSTNGKQRESGGLSQAQFAKLMEGHPAEQTFVDGSEALFRLTKESFWPFGFSGRNWINCDLINKHRAMTIDYDECAIVFHGVRNFFGDSPGNIVESFNKYARDCSSFSVVVNSNEWRICPPVKVHLEDIRGDGVLSNFEESINALMRASGCSRNSTLKEFAKATLENGLINNLRISTEKKNQLLAHILGEGTTSLVKIKKGLPAGLASRVSEIGKSVNRNKVIGQAMLPVELVVTYTGARILENLDSELIEDSSREKDRLRNAVQAAIMLVETCSDDFEAIRTNLVEKYVSKFEKCGQITSPLEGIVFNYGLEDSTYKLTGNFAPINHILGIPRYGRGKIPPVVDGESINEIVEEIDLIKSMTTF